MLRCTDVKEVGGWGGQEVDVCLMEVWLFSWKCVPRAVCLVRVCVCVGLVGLQCAREKTSSEGFLSEVWLFSLSIPAIPP